MSNSTKVSYGVMREALDKYAGTSISKIVFASQPGLVCTLYYYLFLHFPALPFPTSSDGEIIHLSADEHRLRSLLRVLVDHINLTSSKLTGLVTQHGSTVVDAINLSDKYKEMAALLSTQNAQIENNDTEIAELQQKVQALDAQLEALKIQQVDDMLDNDNNGLLLENSEEAVARLREHLQGSQSDTRRLEGELAQLKVKLSHRDIQIIGLKDALDNAKIGLQGALENELSIIENDLGAKRYASEDINKTPQKHANQRCTGSNSPASTSTAACKELFDSDASSEEETEANNAWGWWARSSS